MCARAPNTIKGYVASGKAFIKFAAARKWNCKVITSNMLCQFAVFERDSNKLKVDSIRIKLSNLRSFFQFFEVAWPETNTELQEMFDGMATFEFTAKRQAFPIQAHNLKKLEEFFLNAMSGCNFLDPRRQLDIEQLQIMFMFAMAHDAVLRVSEMLSLKWHHLTVSDLGIEIQINRSKTNQSGGPQIANCVNDNRCHTSTYQWYQIYKDKCPRNEEDWLFPSLTDYSCSITKRFFNKLVKKYSIVMDLDPKSTSSHSFRSGGTTDLVRAGATEQEVKRHGRWKSSSMVDCYFRPTNKEFQEQLIAITATKGELNFKI